MLRPDVKTPGGNRASDDAEASNLPENDSRHGRIGRGLRAYEAAKQKLLTLGLSSDEFRAACRQAADAAGV